MKIGKMNVIAKTTDAAAFPVFGMVNEEDEKAGVSVYDITSDPLFFEKLRVLRDFCGTDATRAWTLGVYFEGTEMYATNNVTIVVSPLLFDVGMPGFTVPTKAIDALLSLATLPTKLVVPQSNGYVAFAVSKSWWLRTTCINLPWSIDAARNFFDKNAWQSFSLKRIDDEMRVAISHISASLPQETSPIYIVDRNVSSSLDLDEQEEGTSIVCDTAAVRCALTSATATRIATHATHADFSQFPAPIPFLGKTIRGVSAVCLDKRIKLVAGAHLQSEKDKQGLSSSPRRQRRG
jgi:hypothetical protein